MTKDLKKRSMEDLQTAMRDYSHFESMLKDIQRQLGVAKKRVEELEAEYLKIEAKVYEKEKASLEIAEDVKAGR